MTHRWQWFGGQHQCGVAEGSYQDGAQSWESVCGQSGRAVGMSRQKRTAQLPSATSSLVWDHSWSVSLIQRLTQCLTHQQVLRKGYVNETSGDHSRELRGPGYRFTAGWVALRVLARDPVRIHMYSSLQKLCICRHVQMECFSFCFFLNSLCRTLYLNFLRKCKAKNM